MSELLQELKRRNVFRVALAYIMLGWIVAQVAELALDSFESPAWVMKTLLLVLALGLPISIFFAWAFELTPEGLKKEKDVDRTQSITDRTGKKLDRTIIALLTAALVFVVVDQYVLVEDTNEIVSTSPAGGVSIAVLPFVNMSADADQEYFSDGISEELLNLLAKIPAFQVAGRTSSFTFKGQNQDLREIGELLGVDNILEGSVRKNANRVRITAQLIKVSDGFHLWSDTYDRELDDIFAVQDDIATKVVNALEVKLLGGSTPVKAAQSAIDSPAAHNAYLQGLFFFYRSGADNLQMAVKYMDEAVRLAPDSALAWAGLSRALDGYAGQSSDDPAVDLARAREAADNALRLDPNLPDSHLAQARILLNWDWDWAGALAAIDRAEALRPGNLDAMFARANLLSTIGDLDGAERIIDEIVAIDPLNDRVPRMQLGTIAMAGRMEEAAALAEALLERDPGIPFARGILGVINVELGRYEAAIQSAKLEPVRFFRSMSLAVAYHAAGDLESAKAAQQDLWDAYGDLASYQQAQVFARWGETETALDWLEKAYEVRDPGLPGFITDSAFVSIQKEPRYQAIVRAMYPNSGDSLLN